MQQVKYVIVKKIYGESLDDVTYEYGKVFNTSEEAQQMINVIYSMSIMAGLKPDDMFVDMKVVDINS